MQRNRRAGKMAIPRHLHGPTLQGDAIPTRTRLRCRQAIGLRVTPKVGCKDRGVRRTASQRMAKEPWRAQGGPNSAPENDQIMPTHQVNAKSVRGPAGPPGEAPSDTMRRIGNSAAPSPIVGERCFRGNSVAAPRVLRSLAGREAVAPSTLLLLRCRWPARRNICFRCLRFFGNVGGPQA